MAGLVLCSLQACAAARAAPTTLEVLLAEAGERHPSIQAQQALVRAAEAGVEAARWQYFPTPFVSVEQAATRSTEAGSASRSRVLQLGFEQPVWNAGRLRAGVDKSVAALARSQWAREEVRQQLGLRIVQSWGEFHAQWAKLQAYEQGRQAHMGLRAVVARRVEEGQSARSDLALADSRLAALEADIANVRTQATLATIRLSQFAGRRVSETELAAAPAAAPDVPAALSDLLAAAQAASPTLQRLQAQAGELRAQADLLRAERWPEVHARLEYQDAGQAATSGYTGTRVTIGLRSRFGAGLSSPSALREVDQQREAAVAELAAQQRALEEQLSTDHAVLASLARREAVLEQARAAAADVLKSWDRQFLAGRKSWQELMNSLRESVQLEAQSAELSAARLMAAWRIRLMTVPPQPLSTVEDRHD